MAILNFDYDAALRQAKEIDSVADEMKTLADRTLQSSIDAIRVNWTGEAATQFLVYCEETKTQLIAKAKSLTTTAAAIRRVAAQLEAAEQRAKEELSRSLSGIAR